MQNYKELRINLKLLKQAVSVINNNILRYARTLYIISSSFRIGRFGAVRTGNLWLPERIIYGFANEQLLHAQMDNYCMPKWTVIGLPKWTISGYPKWTISGLGSELYTAWQVNNSSLEKALKLHISCQLLAMYYAIKRWHLNASTSNNLEPWTLSLELWILNLEPWNQRS